MRVTTARQRTDETGAARGRPLAVQPLVATALVLAVLAAVFAAWSGWSLYRASNAGPPASAQLRDQVLQAGEQAVQNFNTLDYRKVAAGLALWEQSSTGALHAEISGGPRAVHPADRADQDGHHGADPGRRADRAELTGRHGEHHGGRPDHRDPGSADRRPPSRAACSGTLTRTPAGWKLSALGQVPVGAASPGSGKGSAGG